MQALYDIAMPDTDCREFATREEAIAFTAGQFFEFCQLHSMTFRGILVDSSDCEEGEELIFCYVPNECSALMRKLPNGNYSVRNL